jgi:hypothetical protein
MYLLIPKHERDFGLNSRKACFSRRARSDRSEVYVLPGNRTACAALIGFATEELTKSNGMEPSTAIWKHYKSA